MWLFSLIAWLLFFLVLLVLPLFILRLQNKYVIELNGKMVLKTVRYMRWFYWGKTGRFWSDWAESFSLYVEGKKGDADQILEKWKTEDVPEQLRSLTNDYRFYGYTLSRDWAKIIEDYESSKRLASPVSNALYLSACRAYAELKQFDAAAECLTLAKPPETKAAVYEYSSTYLVFLCLTGQDRRPINCSLVSSS